MHEEDQEHGESAQSLHGAHVVFGATIQLKLVAQPLQRHGFPYSFNETGLHTVCLSSLPIAGGALTIGSSAARMPMRPHASLRRKQPIFSRAKATNGPLRSGVFDVSDIHPATSFER